MRASQGAATQHPAAFRRLTRYGVFVSMLVATVDAMPSCACGTVSVVLDGSAHDARSGQAGEYTNMDGVVQDGRAVYKHQQSDPGAYLLGSSNGVACRVGLHQRRSRPVERERPRFAVP